MQKIQVCICTMEPDVVESPKSFFTQICRQLQKSIKQKTEKKMAPQTLKSLIIIFAQKQGDKQGGPVAPTDNGYSVSLSQILLGSMRAQEIGKRP